MSNILFLDLDGPVFPERVIKFHPLNTRDNETVRNFSKKHASPMYVDLIDYIHMDPIAVEMLNRLNEIHTFEVVTSSWHHFLNDATIFEELFEINGLNLTLHRDWITPKKMSSYRINEVGWWIQRHPDCNWAVLDDPLSGGYLASTRDVAEYGLDPRRCVIVNPLVGMEIEHYNQLQNIFNKTLDNIKI